MSVSINSLTFDATKPNERKHFEAFLKTLIDYNADFDNDHFNDIHIKQEENLIVLEWMQIPYSHEWGGTWQFVGEDEVIMKEVYFPDNHCEYRFPEEAEDAIKDWINEQAAKGEIWEKTPYGTWTNITENERFRKMQEEEQEKHCAQEK